jgi:tetratricopeptide (TPR) repeat protein
METIYGCMGVKLPLFGSGPLHGKIEGRDVSFDVVSPTMTIKFHGQRDGDSIAGTYIVSPSEEDGMKQQGEFSLGRDTLESLPIGFNLQDCPDDAAVHREGTLFVQKLGRMKATGTTTSQLRSAPQAGGPSVSRGTQLEPKKPLTQDQVQTFVRFGLGDDSGANLIEQQGIDFVPTEDFLESLKAGGASGAFLKALRAAKQPVPASAKKPLHQVQILALLAGEVPSHRVAILVQERGIDFDVKDDYLQEVRLGGGDDEVITALRSAKVTKHVTVDPAAAARQAEVRQHVAHGVGYLQSKRYADAEAEFRAALLLDSQNADLYVSLSYSLIQQRKWDDAASAARDAVRLNPDSDVAHSNLGFALENKGDRDGGIAEYREALRLNPNSDMAHNNLGVALGHKGDLDGEIAEEHAALRLNPNNDMAHNNLGLALGKKGDRDGEMAEEREALRLSPNNDVAHFNLGTALGEKGDWDAAMAEYREALRLNPNLAEAHVSLGVALGKKGDWDGEVAEEREALRLDPNNALAHVNLGLALGNKGDWDGAITEKRAVLRLNPNNGVEHVSLGVALGKKGDWDGMVTEEREALRLDPNNDVAHFNLGTALGEKGDWDAAMAEEREALRLDPNNALAHACLGMALGKKGDRSGALEEYRAAYTLDPKNVTYKQNYERLSQQVSHPAEATTAVPVPCVILKRMGKQFQFIEGTLPKGIKWHGRLNDKDVREIQDKGGKFVILEPNYTSTDLEGARKGCRE